MQTATETLAVSKKSVWIGRILSGLAAAFLLFDGVMKLFDPLEWFARHLSASPIRKLRSSELAYF